MTAKLRITFSHTARATAWRLAIIAAAIFMACHAAAQNNPYKINDELYQMYRKANARRYHYDGIAMSMEMYSRATELGDRKAQCIALITPVTYWQYKGDEKMLDKAAAKLQEVSLKNGYLQYFYHAATLKVQYYLLKKESMKALAYTEDMVEYAHKHNHTYGIFSGFNNLGKVHFARSEFGMAVNCFKRALDFGSQHLPDQDMATMNARIAECYDELMRYDDMLSYSLSGYRNVRSLQTKKHILRNICVAAYMSGRYDTFRKYYSELERNFGTIHPNTRDVSEIELLAMHAMEGNRLEDADKFVASIPDSLYSRHKEMLYAELTRKYGDNAKLSRRQQKFYRRRIQQMDTVREDFFNMMDARIANMAINYDNRQLAIERQRLANQRQMADISNANLKLANTQLTLRNSSLELSRTRTNDSIMDLSYAKKQLEAETLREEIKASKARQAFGNTLSTAASAFIAITLLATTLYLRNRNRLLKRLQDAHTVLEQTHAQLADALNRAETANRAKSAFIQNLGEEIRQPLNHVAQTALLIADSGNTATAESLHTLNERIHSETGVMLGFVDKALKRTQTEA